MATLTADTRAALSRGSLRGIEALWETTGPRVRRLCRSITGDEEHADELTAQVFQAVYDAGVEGPIGVDLEPWLYRIVVETARPVTPRAPTTVHGDESERVDAILAVMPIEDRLVLALHDVQGFSCAETARILRSSESDVRARITEARVHFNKQWDATRRVREPNR